MINRLNSLHYKLQSVCEMEYIITLCSESHLQDLLQPLQALSLKLQKEDIRLCDADIWMTATLAALGACKNR